jgi:hypothetical protein
MSLEAVLDSGNLLAKLLDADPEADANTIRSAAAGTAQSLDKQPVGTLDFMGEQIQVSTVNGLFVRTPKEAGGLGITDFTMGGNWYGGDPPIYQELCEENEVCLHNLLPAEDFLATMLHELVERYMMKNFKVNYDNAHTCFATPIEMLARLAMKAPGWSWDAVSKM